MNSTKPAAASLTVWAAVAVVLVSVLGLCGLTIDDPLRDEIIAWTTALGGLIGGGVAIYGRVKASRRVEGVFRRPGTDTESVFRHTRYSVLLGVALLPLAAGGCQYARVLDNPDDALLDASEARYAAIAPDHASYVKTDPALTPDERSRRLRTLAAWRAGLLANDRNAEPVATDAELFGNP